MAFSIKISEHLWSTVLPPHRSSVPTPLSLYFLLSKMRVIAEIVSKPPVRISEVINVNQPEWCLADGGCLVNISRSLSLFSGPSFPFPCSGREPPWTADPWSPASPAGYGSHGDPTSCPRLSFWCQHLSPTELSLFPLTVSSHTGQGPGIMFLAVSTLPQPAGNGSVCREVQPPGQVCPVCCPGVTAPSPPLCPARLPQRGKRAGVRFP